GARYAFDAEPRRLEEAVEHGAGEGAMRAAALQTKLGRPGLGRYQDRWSLQLTLIEAKKPQKHNDSMDFADFLITELLTKFSVAFPSAWESRCHSRLKPHPPLQVHLTTEPMHPARPIRRFGTSQHITKLAAHSVRNFTVQGSPGRQLPQCAG